MWWSLLSDVGLDETTIEPVLQKLQQHGFTALGEHGTVDLKVVREILNTAL